MSNSHASLSKKHDYLIIVDLNDASEFIANFVIEFTIEVRDHIVICVQRAHEFVAEGRFNWVSKQKANVYTVQNDWMLGRMPHRLTEASVGTIEAMALQEHASLLKISISTHQGF